MALDIWNVAAGERLNLGELLQAHDDRGLMIFAADNGDLVRGEAGDTAAPEVLFSELLRLAYIGADAIDALADPTRALSHFNGVMAQIRARDAERVEVLETLSPVARRVAS